MSLRWLFRLIGVCLHDGMRREQRDVPYFVCQCGYAVPVITREQKQIRSGARVGELRAQRLNASPVVEMAGRQRTGRPRR